MDEALVWEAIEDWRRKLYLEHWSIDLVFDVDTDEYSAKTEIVENSFKAIITFNNKLDSLSPRQLNELVVHELIHLGHRPIYPGVLKYLDFASRSEQQIIAYYLYDQIELYVDSLASAICNLYMPMCLRELIEDKSDPFYVKRRK